MENQKVVGKGVTLKAADKVTISTKAPTIRLANTVLNCLEILNNHLLLWATEHYENGYWILQQDGAPAHLTKSTQYWCLANLPDASEWPANSPELNVPDFSI
ncbi:hypothetical protein ANCDUO_23604 [Ancylostoma duodenale]|uniref:Uncharacterized protein n=1 Tax=Ancylostoma duodenale TaxID=51022 RepID=A0A0C2FHX9_9BILA|nr:hypothetical protein ANCDUO_23604 [Ancylostoma duodenale]